MTKSAWLLIITVIVIVLSFTVLLQKSGLIFKTWNRNYCNYSRLSRKKLIYAVQ
jgi:hypothetical protein